jgi:hypothetical protein
MKRAAITILASLGAGLVFMNLAGCSDRGPNRAAVFPVEGRLLVSGQPAENAQLAFHPREGASGGHLVPTAVTNPDGTFRLTTYSDGDGAPAGEYNVTVVWQNTSIPVDECENTASHDRLYGYYADPTKTQLHATVGPHSNAIVLQATVGNTGWNLPKTPKPENTGVPGRETKR